MKRYTFCLLALLFACSVTQAQIDNDMSHNGFLSVRGGMSAIQHDGFGGFGGGVSIGEWLIKPLAFQISADFDMVANHPSGQSTNFLYGSAEFIWEPFATFGWLNQNIANVYDKEKFPINLYGLIGLGAISRGGSDSLRSSDLFYDGDFYGMLGAQVSWHFGRNMIDVAGRFYLLANGFDNATDSWGKRAARITVGLTHNFFDEPYHRKPTFASHHPQEDWFMGIGLGVNYSSFEFENFASSDMGHYLGFAPEVMIGKNYSNVWTIRFELSGLRARERQLPTGEAGRMYLYGFLHSDFMINLNHLMSYTRGKRWGILPYLGAGPIWHYENHNISFAADGGCMVRYYIDLVGDVFFDLKYTMMAPRMASLHGGDFSKFGVGLLTATVGYAFNFKYNTTRYNPPVNKVRNRY